MVPVGSGKMDVLGIIRAAGKSLEWLIVDFSMLVMDEIKAVNLSNLLLSTKDQRLFSKKPWDGFFSIKEAP